MIDNPGLSTAPSVRELWRVGVLAALLTAIAFTAFYGLGIVTGSELFFTHDIGGSDIWHLNYPMKHFYREELAAGRLPLWCPEIGTGFPLHAEGQVAALYPANLLLAPLPLDLGFNWGMLLHAVLAGGFAAAFARQLGAGRGGSFLAAIVFAFCGFYVAHLKHINMTASAVYIPLLLLLLERYALRRSVLTLICFAAAVACMVLAGHPQIVYNNLLVAGFYALYLLIRVWRRGRPAGGGASSAARFGGGMIYAVGLGVLIAMPQILPTLELNDLGSRKSGMTMERATEWEYHPKFLLAMVAPGAFGHAGEIHEAFREDPRSGRPVTTPDGRRVIDLVGFKPGGVRMLEWEMMGYAGLLPLVLALIACALGFRRPVVWMLVVFLVASVLLTLGKNGGLFHVFWSIAPGFKLFRFHDRFLLYVDLVLALLAGLGLTWLLARLAGKASRRGLGIAITVVVVAVCFADLYLALGAHNPKVASERWKAPPPIVAAIREHAGADTAPFRVADNDAQRSVFMNAYYRARGWTGDLTPYDVAKNMLDPNLNLLWGITHLQIYYMLFPHWMQEASQLFYIPPHPQVAPDGGMHRTADLFNVRYVISPAGPTYAVDPRTGQPQPLAREVAKLPLVATFPGDKVERMARVEGDTRALPEFTIELRENTDRLPRAFLVPGSRVVPAPRAPLRGLNAAQRELLGARFDPRREVLLHPQAGATTVRRHPRGEPITEAVKFLDYSPQRVHLEATAPKPCWLFLSDTYYPGWTAAVDGRETPIIRANVSGRAVELEAGKHEVVFSYAPQSLRSGLILALLGLALLATVGLQGRMIGRFTRR